MSKKKDVVKGDGPVARIRENSRLMRTHETMVDFINGRHPGRSILDVFASGLFGSDFLHSFDGNLEDDIIYSDEDDDEDEDDRLYSQNSAHKRLEPHPRIRQLTDEEADKHAKELLEEEERRKEKTEKNKRKKMRKKAKRRLEKENAVKDISPEEERGKSDSDNKEENKCECEETQNTTEEVKHDDGENKEENVKTNEKEDEEPEDLDVNNSYASPAEPEDTSEQRPATARRKDKSKLVEVQQLDEDETKEVEKAAIQKKKDEDCEAETEKGTEPAAQEFTKRSRELAGVGNRLAASGQYDMAVKYFTDAIRYNPKEFKLFGNRSLCYERTQQYESALRDADLALCMQPNWIKGLFRKGKALCGLKRYYEASLIYKEVLQLESSSTEAMQELKRAQTLHLMEMGFSWAQSSEALKTHTTLEAAVEALFGDLHLSPADAAASKDVTERPAVQDEGSGEWIVRQTSRPRMQQVREADESGRSRSKSQSPTPLRNAVKVELFPVWVGSLAPAVTYTTLHELFSRAGTVYSIKMLLEHQCAFVNYSKKEDCDRAIHCINGMVVEGAPLSVRFPNKIHSDLGTSKMAGTDSSVRAGSYKKECFFWRTTGCTRSDCTYKHVPEHKNIDKDKFTSRLGNINM